MLKPFFQGKLDTFCAIYAVLNALRLKGLRIYCSAENVALWSKRKGLDPRQGFVSSENATYSPIRAISGGVKVSF